MGFYTTPPVNVISSSYKKLIPFCLHNDEVLVFLKYNKISHRTVKIKVNYSIKKWLYVDARKKEKAFEYYKNNHELNIIDDKLCFVFKKSKVNYHN